MRCSRLAATAATLFVCASLAPHASAQTYAEHIATGFEWPLFGTAAPNDPSRMFVGSTWDGKVSVLNLNTGAIAPTPFLDVSADIPNPLNSTEQGILGMTFDPNYLTNGYVYVDYTRVDNSLEVKRFKVVGDPATSNAVDPASGYTIINIPKGDTYWHNAGWIDFSPKDGYLYVGVGDPGDVGGSQAQNLTNNLNGKILRLDVRSDAFPSDPSRNYAIPPTNPFVGKVGDDEIWAYGFRNPWRSSFDSKTGDLWINDTGENTREEVNYQPANSPGGLNYGWAFREGTTEGPPGHGVPDSPQFTDPVYDYDHFATDPLYQGSVITASALYRGPVAELQGMYLFADFGSRNVWSLDPDAVDQRASVLNINQKILPDVGSIKSIASFGQDSLGNVYLMEYDDPGQGDVWRISTHSKTSVWNGTSAAAGQPGDGITWSADTNWTRDGEADSAFASEDDVLFAAGSAESAVSLDGDRTVSAVTFAAPYTLTGNQLQVLSGNVTVDEGVTATIKSTLVAETVNRSIRKLGPGKLIIDGTANQIAVKEGTLGGSGTLDYLTVREGATVAPGTTTGIMRVTHDFKMYAGSQLSIDLGGRNNADPQNAQFDQLVIGGTATLSGTLSVNFFDFGAGLFAPTYGDVFPILIASDGITGNFDTFNLPVLPRGLIWNEIIDENTYSLEVGHIPGDYTSGGRVGILDYVVWRKMLGQLGTNLAADGSGPDGVPDGIVDQYDYDYWRSHFGDFLAVAASNGVNVPEPSALPLVLLMFSAISTWRTRIR